MALVTIGISMFGPLLLSKLKDKMIEWCVKKGKEKLKLKFLGWVKGKLKETLEKKESKTLEKLYELVEVDLQNLDPDSEHELRTLLNESFKEVQEDLEEILHNISDLKELVQFSIENLNASFSKYDMTLDQRLKSLENSLLTIISEKSDLLLKNIVKNLNSELSQINIKLGEIGQKVDKVQKSMDHHGQVSSEYFSILVEKMTDMTLQIETIKTTQNEQSITVQNKIKETTSIKLAYERIWPKIDSNLSRKLREKMVTVIQNDPYHRTIVNPVVLGAMRIVPRHIFANLDYFEDEELTFLEPKLLKQLYQPDKPMRITINTNSSTPSVIAIMMSLFQMKPNDKILFVGAKGGYIQSIAAEIVGAKGRINIYSKDQEAIIRNENICNSQTPYGNIMKWLYGDSFKDVTRLYSYAPFNCIFICGQINYIPKQFLALLEDKGILIAPIGGQKQQEFTIFEKKGDRYKRNIIRDFEVIFGPVI